jgi:predicted ribosome quality control (RQC) complex YloA/Tae2 family protein
MGAGGSKRAFRYELPGGWTVLAGRTDADNDRLSIKVARPADRWFHVRGMPGSHVLLQGPPGAEPDRDALRTAAAVAAWHSKARDAGVVAVSCTEARHVRKPRGAKPGTVEIRHEIVLKVRPALPCAGDRGGATPAATPDRHPRGRETGGRDRP